MLYHYSFLLLLWLIAFMGLSCMTDTAREHQIHTHLDASQTQLIDMRAPLRDQRLADYLKIKKIIPLENSEQSVIQNVSNVYDTGHEFIISHHQSATTKIFSHQGAYLYDIGRIGKGPGEYIVLLDTDYLSNEKLFFFYGRTKLIIYDLVKQTYWDHIPPFSAYYFEAFDANTYAFHFLGGPDESLGPYNVVITDKEFVVKNKTLPGARTKSLYVDSGYLGEAEEGFVFSHSYSDTVYYYDLQHEQTSIRYVFDFGTKRRQISRNHKEYNKIRIKEGFLKNPYYEDEQIFSFRCTDKGRLRGNIWLRKSGQLLSEESFEHGGILLHLFPPRGRTREGLYISAIVPGWYYTGLKYEDPGFMAFLQADFPQLYEVSKELNGMENPILLIYELNTETASSPSDGE